MPLSNSSPRHKLVIIHGMNNSSIAFDPLTQELISQNFEITFITLPGHKGVKEKFHFEEALKNFAEEFNGRVQEDYSVVAYSQGALYFELAERKKMIKGPKKALYLAPAFSLRNEFFLGKLVDFLPSKLPIRSFAPREIALYRHMLVHEYRTLFEKVRELRKLKRSEFPRLILIDPKDELVDPRRIVLEYPKEAVLFPRNLKEKFRHHLLIHPKFFSEAEWRSFLKLICDFIESGS